MDQDERLKRHLLDLADQADRQYRLTSSAFLSLAEQEIFQKARGEFPDVSTLLYGGYENAERAAALFFPRGLFEGLPEEENPLSVLLIEPLNPRFTEALTHRDYLGAILNLGIERDLTGDILVKGEKAYLFCLKTIAPYLKENLIRVRNTSVKVQEAAFSIPELAPEFQELRVNVASERFDAVIAAMTGLSRGKAQELFPRQRVQVNGKVTENPDLRLKEGDVISVRGFGKAIYDGVSGESRKGRLYVSLRKYV